MGDHRFGQQRIWQLRLWGDPGNRRARHDRVRRFSPQPGRPSGPGADPEWLRLGYATPIYATGVRIHETFIGGFVTGLDLVEPNGTVHPLSIAIGHHTLRRRTLS